MNHHQGSALTARKRNTSTTLRGIAAVSAILVGAVVGIAPLAGKAAQAQAQTPTLSPALAVFVPPVAPVVAHAPKVLFGENFESINVAVKRLDQYRGAMPTVMTYTANPFWLSEANCNGMVQSAEGHSASLCGLNPRAQALARALGVFDHAASPGLNHAVIELTGSARGASDLAQLQTAKPIVIGSKNRFVSVSFTAASDRCAGAGSAGHDPLLQWSVQDGPASHAVFSSPANPCAAVLRAKSSSKGVVVTSFVGDSAALVSGSTVGVTLRNGTGDTEGNDLAFDDLKVLDVTPQLTASFVGSPVSAAAVSRLSYRITNTTELGAKSAFTISNVLPVGVRVATTKLLSTCTATTGNPLVGAKTVNFTASLAAGVSSCTISIEVVAASPGVYLNDASRFALVGLDASPSTTLTVSSMPRNW